MRSVCQQKGKGVLCHNKREYISPNVDKNRMKDNVILKQESLQTAYNKCFGAATKAYNEKQKRKDRQIDDYFKHLFGVSADSAEANSVLQSKDKTKSFYEDIVQIGDMNDTGIKNNPKEARLAKLALMEYAKGFQDRNPYFYVFHSVIHMDEATPHLHLDYVPWADDYKRGLEVQNGYTKALERMGYVDKWETNEKGEKTKFISAFSQWREKERDVFREICKRYGLDPKPKELEESRHKTYTPGEYRELMSEAEESKDKAEQDKREAERIKQKAEQEAEQIVRTARKKANAYDNRKEDLQEKEEELRSKEQALQSKEQELQRKALGMEAEIKKRVEARLALQEKAESVYKKREKSYNRELPYDIGD